MDLNIGLTDNIHLFTVLPSVLVFVHYNSEEFDPAEDYDYTLSLQIFWWSIDINIRVFNHFDDDGAAA